MRSVGLTVPLMQTEIEEFTQIRTIAVKLILVLKWYEEC